MRVKIVLLISLFSTNIGEWVYFIALNLFVLNLTDSGLAVGILYVIMPIAMLVTNSWAGSFVDRVNIRTLLCILNVLRAVMILCIAFTSNIFFIYGLSFFLQIGNALYSTASFVYIARIIPEHLLPRFNAWKSMAQSSGFILGPAIAGVLFMIGSIKFAILMNAFILIVSSVLYLFLPKTHPLVERKPISLQLLKEDWREVLAYSKIHQFVVILFILYGLYMVVITSIDSLEAAFALKTLRLDESSYGLLVSIAGVGFVIGSAINIKWTIPPLKAVVGGMLLTGIGYFIYCISTTFSVAAIGFFVLSAALTFVNVGYTTFIQKNISNDILGRFMSIYSMIEAFAMLLLIIAFGLMAEILNVRIMVQSGTFLLIIIMLSIMFARKRWI